MYAFPHIHCIVRWLYAIVAKHLVNRYCSKDCVTQAKNQTTTFNNCICQAICKRCEKLHAIRKAIIAKKERKGDIAYIRIHSHCNQLRCIWWFSFELFFNRVLLWLKFCTGIVISLSRHFGTTSRSLYLRVSLNILDVFFEQF